MSGGSAFQVHGPAKEMLCHLHKAEYMKPLGNGFSGKEDQHSVSMYNFVKVSQTVAEI